MTRLNDILNAYGSIDAEGGEPSFYTEVASNERDFTGYAKPIFKDVEIFSISNDVSNPLKLVWEGIVSFILEVFTNQRHGQIASKILLEGKFENPKVNLWSAIGSVMSNAFISALKSKKDGTISLTSKKDVK